MNKAKPRVLVSWIGGNDLKAPSSKEEEGHAFGPVASTLKEQAFGFYPVSTDGFKKAVNLRS